MNLILTESSIRSEGIGECTPLATLSVYGLSNPRKPVEMTAIDLKGHGCPYQLALSSDDNWLYIVKNIVKTRTFKRHRSVTAASSTSSEPRSTELLQKSVRLL